MSRNWKYDWAAVLNGPEGCLRCTADTCAFLFKSNALIQFNIKSCQNYEIPRYDFLWRVYSSDRYFHQPNQSIWNRERSPRPQIKWTVPKYALRYPVWISGALCKRCRWKLMFAPSWRNIQLCFRQLYKLHFTRIPRIIYFSQRFKDYIPLFHSGV